MLTAWLYNEGEGMAQDSDALNRGINYDDAHKVAVLIQELTRQLLDERQQLGQRVDKHFRQLMQNDPILSMIFPDHYG